MKCSMMSGSRPVRRCTLRRTPATVYRASKSSSAVRMRARAVFSPVPRTTHCARLRPASPSEAPAASSYAGQGLPTASSISWRMLL